MKTKGIVAAVLLTLIPGLHAESFTTNIIDGIVTNAGPQLTVGATGPYNFLLVTNAGKLTNGTSILGDTVGADNNSAVVTGSNSVWHSTTNFLLGNTGSLNHVSLLNGGVLSVGVLATFGIDQNSRSNVILLTGPGSSFYNYGALRIGLFGSDNGLIIREGARASIGNASLGPPIGAFALLEGIAIIGREEGATGNFGLVQGSGSLWNLPTLTVGRAGHHNFVHILDGAVATAFRSNVGQLGSAAGNEVRVSGSGTLWDTYMELIVGSNGPSSVVDVTDGARLLYSTITVGLGSSSNQLNVRNAIATDRSLGGMSIGVGSNANFNVVTFDGASARGTNDRAFVGLQGASNSLAVLNGAEFTLRGGSAAPRFVVGAGELGRGNSVELSGAGSKLIANVPFTLGDSGSGNRLLVDQAHLQSFSARIGGTCGASSNVVLIQRQGAVWTNGTLELGFCSDDNRLTIVQGAQVLAGRVASSIQGGTRNVIEVSGDASFLRATDLVIGNSGATNALVVTSGGTVAGRHDQLGASGSDNAALVYLGSSWSNVTLVVGDSGARNSLRIDEGASVQTGELMMGRLGTSSENIIEVIGPESRLFAVTNLNIGGFGDANRLRVADGANVFSRNIHLGGSSLALPGGFSLSHFNRLSIIGTNSRVVAGSNIVVGFQGNSNRLEVLDGADLDTVRAAIIGDDSGARNSVIVSGRGSRWTITNDLVVGRRAQSSSLVISNGGFVRSHSGHIGDVGGLHADGSACMFRVSGSGVRVTGLGSVWAMADQLVVGNQAILNSLRITDGGAVSAQRVIVGVTDGGVSADPGCRVGEGGVPFLNELEIAGGNLRAGNFGPDLLEVRYGTLRLRSGVASCAQLLMTNQWSRLELFGGALMCSEAIVHNRRPLVIGDGLHNARFQGRDIAAPGGAVIREHATLFSAGRVSANVTNFGTVSVSALVITSNFVQQPSGSLLVNLFFERASRLTVSNVALLDGKLLLQREVFPPSNSVVITAAAVNGTFSKATNGARIKTTDNLGSYVVEYTATSVALRDYQSTDLDGDMIEDAWATQYFGHSPLTPVEKAADDDGDGSSNYDEFIAGTDPKNSASALRASISYANGAATVAFPCQEAKRYNIWWSADLITWNHVVEPTFSFPEAGVCRWTDDGQWTEGVGGPARFFRVSVQ